MTGSDKTSSMKDAAAKAKFMDAVRRHICHVMGFDFALLDLITADQAVNVATFSGQADDAPVDDRITKLVDEEKQPLTVAQTATAGKVIEARKPWSGKVFLKDDADTPYPYVIVPIIEGSEEAEGVVRGLLRVVSLDADRKVGDQDIATLFLFGQHLSGKLPDVEEFGKEDVATEPAQKETVLVVHSDRLTRRRISRALRSKYLLFEADSAENATTALNENRVALVVADAKAKGESGKAFFSELKENDNWKHIPLILVAAEGDLESKVEGLNAGADDCLSDTCPEAEIVARVSASLRLLKTQRDLATQGQLLEDYAQRLEAAFEEQKKNSIDVGKRADTLEQRNKELRESRWKEQVLLGQAELMQRVSDAVRKSISINESVGKLLEELVGHFNLDCAFIVVPSEEEEEDTIRSEHVSDDAYRVMESGIDLEILEIFKTNFRHDQSVIVSDVTRDRSVDAFRKSILAKYPAQSLFWLPVSFDEELLGILGGMKCESSTLWSIDNKSFFKSMAGQVSISVANSWLYARVQRQATTDGLTGLFNRRTGMEKLAEQLRVAGRYKRNLAVLSLDVDYFKSINDNYGHPAGDTVLKEVARVMREDCRDVDIPVRMGGEEFLIILPEINQQGAVVVAERVRKHLSREIIRHEDLELNVTASMGVAAFPEDADDQEKLLELADKALYMSKRMGRNQVHTAGDLMFSSYMGDKQKAEPAQAPAEEMTFDPAPAPVPSPGSGEAAVEPPAATEAPPPQTAPAPAESDLMEQAVQASSGAGPTEQAVQEAPVETHPSGPVEQAPAQATPDASKSILMPEVVQMVKGMAEALYSKSEYNKVHHLETARFAELLAKMMGLTQQQVEQVRVASLLHDVGILSVPEDIVNKKGPVTPEEMEVISQHVTTGAQMLRPINALKEICEIVEHHHECWDGSGYPLGLAGEEIPLPARILAIVDSYHAMISDRPYRKAMTPEAARKALQNGAGKQWDPFLVDIFLATLSQMER